MTLLQYIIRSKNIELKERLFEQDKIISMLVGNIDKKVEWRIKSSLEIIREMAWDSDRALLFVDCRGFLQQLINVGSEDEELSDVIVGHFFMLICVLGALSRCCYSEEYR
jgi:hypothetical protein